MVEVKQLLNEIIKAFYEGDTARAAFFTGMLAHAMKELDNAKK